MRSPWEIMTPLEWVGLGAAFLTSLVSLVGGTVYLVRFIDLRTSRLDEIVNILHSIQKTLIELDNKLQSFTQSTRDS